MSWPKGKPHPPEMINKMKATFALKSKIVICGFCGKKFKPWWSKSKYCTRLCANRARASKVKGIFPPQLATTEAKENNRNAHKGLQYTDDINKKKGHSRRPGRKQTEDTIKKLRVIANTEQRQAQLREMNSDPQFQSKRLKACRKKPNKPECILESILNKRYPEQWKFVGDGKVMIECLNPDFINCNGRKEVIELFGDYWHGPLINRRNKTEDERRIIYSKYGYRLLVIWEHELKDEEAVVGKIIQFKEG